MYLQVGVGLQPSSQLAPGFTRWLTFSVHSLQRTFCTKICKQSLLFLWRFCLHRKFIFIAHSRPLCASARVELTQLGQGSSNGYTWEEKRQLVIHPAINNAHVVANWLWRPRTSSFGTTQISNAFATPVPPLHVPNWASVYPAGYLTGLIIAETMVWRNLPVFIYN